MFDLYVGSCVRYPLQVHAFFGPVCEYALAPVARYTPIWNIPILTPGALAHDFGANKRTEYSLLTRVGATSNSLASCIRSVMTYYNWSTIKVSQIRLSCSES